MARRNSPTRPKPQGSGRNNSSRQEQENQQKNALKAGLKDQIQKAFEKLVRETLIFRLGVQAELFGNFAGENPLQELQKALLDEKKLEEKEKQNKQKNPDPKAEKVRIKLIKKHGEKNEQTSTRR